MAYIDQLLARGEKVVFSGHRHAFVLIGSIIAELLLMGVLVAAGTLSMTAFDQDGLLGLTIGQLIMAVCSVISIGLIASALLDFARWNTEQYVVTDQRVISVRGIFNKSVVDSSLEKINDVELRQSWLGRIFDFGDLEILTGSELGVNTIRQLGHPLDFKRAMLEAKQNHGRGFGFIDPQAAAAYAAQNTNRGNAADDLQHTLQKLAELHKQGLLSNDEYEAKRREVLARV